MGFSDDARAPIAIGLAEILTPRPLFQLGAANAIVHIDGCRPTWPGHFGLLDMRAASPVGSEGRASRR